MMTRPRVIIESPYAGEVERNMAYARAALLHSVRKGEAPIASHLLYTQILNDQNLQEREEGISCGLAWMAAATTVAFYIDLGVSTGMRHAYATAIECLRPIQLRSFSPNHTFAVPIDPFNPLSIKEMIRQAELIISGTVVDASWVDDFARQHQRRSRELSGE